MGVLWTGDDSSNADLKQEGAERCARSSTTPRVIPRPSSLDIVYQLIIAALLGILAGLFAWMLATGLGFSG